MGSLAHATLQLKVTLLLADSAQEINGKLYILGGGWSITGPIPTPSALAVKIEVPWDRANLKHEFHLELLTSDGEPVPAPFGAEGEMVPVRVDGEFEPGRPPGIMHGSPLDVAMAFNFPPFQLDPQSRYQWRLSVPGFEDEDWTVGFSTRPPLPGQIIGGSAG